MPKAIKILGLDDTKEAKMNTNCPKVWWKRMIVIIFLCSLLGGYKEWTLRLPNSSSRRSTLPSKGSALFPPHLNGDLSMGKLSWKGTACTPWSTVPPSLVAKDCSADRKQSDSLLLNHRNYTFDLPSWCLEDVPCAVFKEGVWNGNITSEMLEDTNRKRRGSSGVPPVSGGRSPCGTADFYSSPITVHETFFEEQSAPHPEMPLSYPFTLKSKTCPNSFKYFNNLELMSVFHQHAWEGVDRTRESFGRGILFYGDSMVRQLFVTAVSAFRGDSVAANDHVAITDLLYIAYEDRDVLVTMATSDRHDFCDVLKDWFGYSFKDKSRGKSLGQPAFACPQSSGTPTNPSSAKEIPLFVLYFAWNPIFYYVDEASKKLTTLRFETFAFSRVHLRIGGYLYWVLDTRYAMDNNHPFSTHFRRFVDPWLAADPNRKYVWFTTPMSDTSRANSPFHDRTRNARMHRWILEGDSNPCSRHYYNCPSAYNQPLALSNYTNDPHESSSRTALEDFYNRRMQCRSEYNNTSSNTSSRIHRNRQRFMLDLAGLHRVSDQHSIPLSNDSIHASCRWQKPQPNHIESRTDNPFECRDPVNGAAVQWLAALLKTLS